MGGLREGFHHRPREWEPSPQQERVLNAVAQGLTNDEIAAQLEISPDGVKWHISELLGRTGLKDRYDLAEWWTNKNRQPIFVPSGWPVAIKLGMGAGVVTLMVTAFVLGSMAIGGGDTNDEPWFPAAADVGEEDSSIREEAIASSSPAEGGKPFFAFRQADYAGVPTVRLSGGDLDHPVTIPPIEFSAACANSTQNGLSCSAGASRANLPEPNANLPRYRFEFVYLGADYDVPNEWYWYGGAVVPTREYWYVPAEPAMVGPLPRYGWIELGRPVAALIERYIVLSNAGLVPESPTFEEGLDAGFEHFGGQISVRAPGFEGSMEPLPEARARELASLLTQIEPVLVAIRGNLVGQRQVNSVPIAVTLGSEVLPFFYVPPGEITDEGLLLLSRASLASWGYLPSLSPPGYTKTAYAVPSALEDLMAELGFPRKSLVDDIESSTLQPGPTRWRFIDRIEIWRAGGEERTVLPDLTHQPCPDGCDLEYPQAVLSGEPLKVAIWPTGIPPFPEAVSPALYDYYLDDGTGRGVLVETDCPAVGGGRCVRFEALSFYPPPPLDAMLRDAALLLR